MGHNGYFSSIAEQEQVDITDDALHISRAADGSVRDGLSLLDQAIALGNESVSAELVQSMLGLAGRCHIRLFDLIMSANTKWRRTIWMYAKRRPTTVVQDLLVVYWARIKIAPEIAQANYTPEIERVRGSSFAESLPCQINSYLAITA